MMIIIPIIKILLKKIVTITVILLYYYLLLISGGFAFVYVAQDVTTGKDYALKVSILCLSFIMLYQIYLCACQNFGRVKRAYVKVYGIKRKEEHSSDALYNSQL